MTEPGIVDSDTGTESENLGLIRSPKERPTPDLPFLRVTPDTRSLSSLGGQWTRGEGPRVYFVSPRFVPTEVLWGRGEEKLNSVDVRLDRSKNETKWERWTTGTPTSGPKPRRDGV